MAFTEFTEFKGRRVIVSGAAFGMGNLIVRQFAELGASVLACDVREDLVGELAACANAKGGNVIAAGTDVEKYESVEKAVKLAAEKFGGADFLFNFAGGASTRVFADSKPFWERDPRHLEWCVNVNLRGALFFARAVFPEMIRNPGGVIVNVGSIDGVTGSPAVDYPAAKKGIEGMTKSLAIAGARFGIRAVCVIPGPVMTRPGMAGMKTLLGRAAEPEELTEFMMFLCSERARSITGSSHLVDNGRACGVMEY